MWRSAVFVFIWGLFLVLGVSDAQTMDFKNAEDLIMTASGKLFGTLKAIAGVGLFGYALYLFIDGYTKKQLHQNWILIVGIAIFLVVLFKVNVIYRALIGWWGGNNNREVYKDGQGVLWVNWFDFFGI